MFDTLVRLPPLTSTQKHALRSYKYSGCDNSLIYVHVTNPIYVSISETLPRWLAPNLITFTGFTAMLCAYAFMLYFSPTLHADVPGWVNVFGGCAIIFYQTLDAVDGKQARRTNSSSPLGLLFDHGCDATNAVLLTLQSATMMRVGADSPLTCLTVGCALLGFYSNTLEEFHIGELVLPVFNGPNEGLWILAILHWVTAYCGGAFWLEDWLGCGYQNNTYFAVWSIATIAVTVLTQQLHIYHEVYHPRKTKVGYHKAGPHTYLQALLPILSLCAFLTVWASWCIFSPAQVFTLHSREMCWIMGFIVCRWLLQMMLSHLVNHPQIKLFDYHVVNAAFVLILLTFGTIKSTGLLPATLMTEANLVHFLFVLTAVYYFVFLVDIINTMKTTLGVKLFTIPYTASK